MGDGMTAEMTIDDNHAASAAIARDVADALPVLVRSVLHAQERRRSAPGVGAQISLAQYLALHVIGDRQCTVSQVAEGTGVAVSSATRMIQGLERLGLVERIAAVDDRRTKVVALTAQGTRAYEHRQRMIVERFAEYVAPLDADTREAFARGVAVITAAIRAVDDARTRPAG